MKKIRTFIVGTLIISAFVLASCGTSGDKAKTECKHQHDKEHKCDKVKMDSCAQAKMDTCKHEETKAHECEHKKAE